MSPRGRGKSESSQTTRGLAPDTPHSSPGATQEPPLRAPIEPATSSSLFDGAVFELRSTELSLERVARALGRAGYANAIWPVDASFGVLPPAYVYVPAVLTMSHVDWFAHGRPNRHRVAVAPDMAPELHRALLFDEPVLGSAPGPAWLLGLSHGRRTRPSAVLGDASLLASAYVTLRVDDRTFGVLGLAGHRLTAPDIRTLSAVAADLALRLEYARMNRSIPVTIDRRQAVRLLEEITQPLTALVARAEVAMDLVLHGPLEELPNHMSALRDSAQRLAAWTDATHVLLGDVAGGASISSAGSSIRTDRPVAQP